MSLTNKQVITGSIIIGFFIASAILTVAVGNEDTDTSTTESTSEIRLSEADSILIERSRIAAQERQGGGDQTSEQALTPGQSAIHSEVLEEDPFEELNSLIGLEDVKAEVRQLANIVKIQKQREAKGLKNTHISYHCVFSGSPGTGKTTVARILARIYKDLGVLKKGHLVETDRSGLVGEYVGQTGPKTNHLIDSALGGVLFIDEAYALVDAKGEDYGAEAIATLLKRMEDDRDNLVVIVAGYSQEMKRFIASNPGLQSRFTRYIDFPDYSADELYEIFLMRARKYMYRLDPEADEYLHEILTDVVEHKTRNFGNGRYVRNLFEMCTMQQADRLSQLDHELTEDDLCVFVKADLEKAYLNVKK